MDVKNFYEKSNMPKKDQKRLVAALQRKMRTPTEISKALGLDYNVLRTAYKHLGINSAGILRERERQEEAPWVEPVRELAGKGKDRESIAELLGIPQSLVVRVIRKNDIKKVRQPRHGTATEYMHFGCRCQPCYEANAARMKQEALNRKARQNEAPHGTESGYVNWGCRCEKCTLAGLTAMRARLVTPPETQTRKGERWVDSEVDSLRSYDKVAREHAIELGRTTVAVNARRAIYGIRKVENG